jgi:hypothetical protein
VNLRAEWGIWCLASATLSLVFFFHSIPAMAAIFEPTEVLALSSAVLLLLLNSYKALHVKDSANKIDDADGSEEDFTGENRYLLGEADCSAVVALHHVMMLSVFTIAGEDLGFWTRPRSTTWFSRFVVSEFEDDRWVQCFRMTKMAVFSLAEMLRSKIQRRDTWYRLAIPVLVRVCCTLFKLAQGCSIFICSELFAIVKSSVSKMLQDTVYAMNETLRHELTWPNGQKLLDCQLRF